jgi:hypothetical protein
MFGQVGARAGCERAEGVRERGHVGVDRCEMNERGERVTRGSGDRHDHQGRKLSEGARWGKH